MKKLTSISLLLSAALALATSTHSSQVFNSDNLSTFVFSTWTVSLSDTGCSHGDGRSLVTFNVSCAATASEPGIAAAACAIDGDDPHWQECSSSAEDSDTLSSVWAMPMSDTADEASRRRVVALQHRFVVHDRLTHARACNVTGNIMIDLGTVVSLPVDVTVKGTVVSESRWWLSVRPAGEGGGRACGRRFCEPVRGADGSARGFMRVDTEQRFLRVS